MIRRRAPAAARQARRAVAVIAAFALSQGAVALIARAPAARAAGTGPRQTAPTTTVTVTAPTTSTATTTVTTTTSTTTTPARPKPGPAEARLLGTFLMHGRLTVAVGVAGEHRGQRVTRRWYFRPACGRGACRTVMLVRLRGTLAQRDHVVLRRHRAATYVGRGTFYAPLECAGRDIEHGERVPFKITVRITRAVAFGPVVIASAIRATYVNSQRTNLTSCVAFPGHDAATYRGRIVGPATRPPAYA